MAEQTPDIRLNLRSDRKEPTAKIKSDSLLGDQLGTNPNENVRGNVPDFGVRLVKDVDLGSSYREYIRQNQIAQDELLVREAFEDFTPGEDITGVTPEGFGFKTGTEPGDEALNEEPPEEGQLNALGIAAQILAGGPLDAVVNTGEMITDTGEWIRDTEIGGATVEQHLQALDQALGTGKLFSGKTEIGIGTLENKGGAGVQMARGLQLG